MVSVIIPVYNGAAFLEECLHSVMEQTYRDLEIIVIDDGSTDNSYEICERLAKEDKRIVLIRQENAGVSVTRNKGLGIARGEYLMFVDADDTIPINATELLVNDIESTKADMSIGSYEAFRKHIRNEVIYESSQHSTNELRHNLILAEKLLPFVWGRLYRKAVIANNAMRFIHGIPYGEDNIFNLTYCENVNKVSVISDVVYHYRLGGIASSVKYYPDKDKYALALVNAYKSFFECEEISLSENFNKALFSGLCDCFSHYIVNVPFRRVLNKITNVLHTFSKYINEENIVPDIYGKRLADAIIHKNVFLIYQEVYRQCFTAITKKKIKKLYYRHFSRRI